MRKLPAVEEAKALMRESQEWGVWRWLMEKKRVRAAADAAWAALGEAEERVRAGWSQELQRAYEELLLAEESGQRKRRAKSDKAPPVGAAVRQTAQRLKEAAGEAFRAHMEAEDIFAEAEKRLSTSMAKQGAQRAIEAWELTEKSIRQAEAAERSPKPAR